MKHLFIVILVWLFTTGVAMSDTHPNSEQTIAIVGYLAPDAGNYPNGATYHQDELAVKTSLFDVGKLVTITCDGNRVVAVVVSPMIGDSKYNVMVTPHAAEVLGLTGGKGTCVGFMSTRRSTTIENKQHQGG